jgi:hypothetical protein
MSILGATIDNFVLSLGSIVDFIINLILGLKDIVISFFAIIGTLLNIIYYLFGALEFFVSIILNPYLLALFLLATSFYYASFTASTRKQLMFQVGVYWKYVFETLGKIVHAIYTIVIRIVVGIIDMI